MDKKTNQEAIFITEAIKLWVRTQEMTIEDRKARTDSTNIGPSY